MKPTVQFSIPFGKSLETALAGRYTIVTDPAVRKGVDAIITVGSLKTDGAMMDEMPDLKIICAFGSGHEGIDVAAAKARGIAVTNTVGSNAAAVADLAVALLLASVRHVATGDALVRAGGWHGTVAGKLLSSRGITGRRVGIVGLGAIGRKIAGRLAAFETEIGYHNRHPRADAPWRYFDSLAALAEWADALMLAHRADDTNRHMIGADIFRLLGSDGHVVNITRGSAIDEDALIDALKAGTIAGAGLDVFEGEPNVRADLRALPNVVLTPHVGGGTRESLRAMAVAVVANLDAFFAGEPLPSPVTA